MGVAPKNADAGSVAHVADAASIVGITSKAYPQLTDAPWRAHQLLSTSRQQFRHLLYTEWASHEVFA
jgi:hypothetical protein